MSSVLACQYLPSSPLHYHSTAGLRQRTIVLWILWMAANSCFYGMIFSLPAALPHVKIVAAQPAFDVANGIAHLLDSNLAAGSAHRRLLPHSHPCDGRRPRRRGWSYLHHHGRSGLHAAAANLAPAPLPSVHRHHRRCSPRGAPSVIRCAVRGRSLRAPSVDVLSCSGLVDRRVGRFGRGRARALVLCISCHG